MPGKIFHILIADDDIDDQELIREAIEGCRLDIVTHTVNDGVQVMDYLLKKGPYKTNPRVPDLLLLDLNMPLMDGFEVLKEIRRHPQLRPIPVYVITTSRSVDHINHALDLGANGFYSKGARSKDITQIVMEVMGKEFPGDAVPGE